MRNTLNAGPMSPGATAGNRASMRLPVVLALALPCLAAAFPGALHAQAITNTTTALNLSPNPASTNQAVIANVTVSAVNERQSAGSTPNGSLPSGTVAVSGGGQSCAAPLNSGVGNCTLSFPAPGVYTITAEYPGDAVYSPSSTSQDLTVNGSPVVSTASVPALSSGLLALLGAMLAALAWFAPRKRLH